MGVPKGTPRPPNAGRKKGTPNKRTAARAALRGIDAEGIAGAGYGPGDAYRALWQQVGILREELAAEERKRSTNLSWRDTLRDQFVRVLYKILPYERPRLAAITVAGDPNNPPRVRADLTRLTGAELRTLMSASRPALGTLVGLVETPALGSANNPIISDEDERVLLYLNNLAMLWQLEPVARSQKPTTSVTVDIIRRPSPAQDR